MVFMTQDHEAIVDENDNCEASQSEAVTRAKAAFGSVFANGTKIKLDQSHISNTNTRKTCTAR